MRSILFITSIVLSICLIIGGNFHYKQKLTTIAAESSKATDAAIQTTNSSPTIGKVESTTTDEELTGLLKEWTDLFDDEEIISLTFFGSSSVTNDKNTSSSWPLLLQEKINQLSNVDEFEFTIIAADRLLSTDVLEEDYIDQVIESKPDVLLFEPFFLNDTGKIRIEDTMDSLELMLLDLNEALPTTTIVIVPANPTYNATFYASQINRLEDFAMEHGYLYADHWQAWPAIDDSELNKYIENARPNDDGHALWAEAIFKYLSEE